MLLERGLLWKSTRAHTLDLQSARHLMALQMPLTKQGETVQLAGETRCQGPQGV